MAKLQRALALVAGLVGAGAWFQPAVAGSDLWWHLAAGREIVGALRLPTTDQFSYTMAGQPWMHHEWLWGVGYWLIYRAAPEGVALANLALVFAVFGVWLTVALRHSDDALASALALWAAGATCYWFLDIRPHEVTLLFVGIVVLTRERPWAHWLWPALMIPWCNLHGGFVFGFGTIGLFALVSTLEDSLEAGTPKLDRGLWLGVGLTALALLCNPWGWHILEYPAAYLDSRSPFRQILEWQPPPFDLDLRGFEGRFFALLGLAAAAAGLELAARVRGGRRAGDSYLVALAGVTCAMAITSRRFIPLFALCSLPLVARLLATLLAVLRARLPEAQRSRLELGLGVGALLLAGVFWRDVRLFPRPLERWTESHLYPRAALRYAQALDAGNRVLNYYNWGGYIMLHAPELKVLIDGRANTLYSEKLYNDYVAMISGSEGLAGRLAAYAPDLAILPPGPNSLAHALTEPQFAWRLVYVDDQGAVLLPPTSPRLRAPLPDVDTVLGDDPQYQIALAATELERGQLEDARARLQKALGQDPLQASGYTRLAESYALEHDLAGIADTIERGIALEPRLREPLLLQESAAYEQAGATELAYRTLQRAMPRGPFSRPESVLRNLERLRLELARR
ncbi:MAG TPA: hypothetical protein VMR50_20260 [Myxococcota bacterium]|nr:hypothetical protein [Myxococcota bacterium]